MTWVSQDGQTHREVGTQSQGSAPTDGPAAGNWTRSHGCELDLEVFALPYVFRPRGKRARMASLLGTVAVAAFGVPAVASSQSL